MKPKRGQKDAWIMLFGYFAKFFLFFFFVLLQTLMVARSCKVFFLFSFFYKIVLSKKSLLSDWKGQCFSVCLCVCMCLLFLSLKVIKILTYIWNNSCWKGQQHQYTFAMFQVLVKCIFWLKCSIQFWYECPCFSASRFSESFQCHWRIVSDAQRVTLPKKLSWYLVVWLLLHCCLWLKDG